MPHSLAKPEFRRKIAKFLAGYSALCSRKKRASNVDSSS